MWFMTPFGFSARCKSRLCVVSEQLRDLYTSIFEQAGLPLQGQTA